MRVLRIIVATVLVSTSVAASAQEITQSGFSPLYTGIAYETATIPTNPTAAGAPTTSRAYIARIDLRAPGIRFIEENGEGEGVCFQKVRLPRK